MSDRLLSLSHNRAARSVAKGLGLSLPPTLAREVGPGVERPLDGRVVHVLAGPGAELGPALAGSLAPLGANVGVLGGPEDFTSAGEAWARPALDLETTPGDGAWALVVDASGLGSVGELRFLYEALAPRLRGLGRSGRVLVLGRPPEAASSVGMQVARRALEGFTRSVAKEVGRSGATANLVEVPNGAEDRVGAVLAFLLSPRSTYVSGQPWRLSAALPAAVHTVRPLDGRVALVTGSARGIGAATARALGREGAKVIVHDHPSAQELADSVAAEVHGRAITADIATAEGRAALLAEAGELDILVQNAGITRDKTLGRMSEEQWDMVLAVNLEAVVALADAVCLREGGAMVCLSSIGGIAGNVGQTNYAATKAGVIGLVEALAPSWAERGLAVSAVAPGFIETRMTAEIPFATREVARRLANLSQGGLPEDVAEVLTFLASPGGRALTGRVLRVCGGNFIGA